LRESLPWFSLVWEKSSSSSVMSSSRRLVSRQGASTNELMHPGQMWWQVGLVEEVRTARAALVECEMSSVQRMRTSAGCVGG